MSLYYIQDSDRPMYVKTTSWERAVRLWKDSIAKENNMPQKEVEEPSGIQFVAEDAEIIWENDYE